jgi:hypothetical protein
MTMAKKSKDSETEKDNDPMAAIKKLGTDQLEQLQDAVRSELKARSKSEDADAEDEKLSKLSKLSDSAFKQLVTDLMDAKPSKKDEE